jgi:hypothetical protein
MTAELFTYKCFDSTTGERELFGIVNAANMGEAFQKAVSFLARRHTPSRIEIERTERWYGDDLGHLSRVAELLASHVVECTTPGIGGALRINSPEQIRKVD